MKLEIYKSVWGMTGPLEAQIEQCAAAGYDGVETPVGDGERSAANLDRLLAKYKLKCIAMGFTSGADAAAHAADFERQLKIAAECNPVKITFHSARDSFSFDEQCRFYEAAASIESKVRLPVAHETHRGRAMYTPWSTAAILKRFPTLRICADFSHWTCVCESMLDGNAAEVELAIGRTLHTHARVGHEEGPQVSDPAAPEWARCLERFDRWWTSIWKHQRSAGMPLSTITPEFGPGHYMPLLPYTQQPVADLWQVCQWMSDHLRKRYAESMA